MRGRFDARCAGLLAGAALLATGAWLARPTASTGFRAERPALRALLVDSSASARALAPGWRAFAVRALAEEARAAAAAGEDVLVVAYAEDVVRVFPSGRAADLLARLAGRDSDEQGARLFDPSTGGDGLGSDLAGALEVAAAALGEPGRAPGRLVLLSDLRWTEDGGRAPSAALAEALARVREVRVVRPPAPVAGDLRLAEVIAPELAPFGAPVELALALAWAPGARDPSPGPVTVALEALRLGGERDAAGESRSFRLAASDLRARPSAGAEQRFEARIVLNDLPRGIHRWRVTVEREGGPRGMPHNDAAFVDLRVGEGARVLVHSLDPAVRAELAAALRRAPFRDFGVLVSDASDLGAKLPDADVLVTAGVPLGRLPSAVLDAHLAEGKGWLQIAGGDLLRFDAEAAEEWLALRALSEDREPRDVLFLVDGSSSMKGEPWRRVGAAIARITPEIPAADAVELRFFNRLLGRVAARVSSRDPQARLDEVKRVLSATVPGGQTHIVAVIDEYLRDHAARRGDAGRDMLVILLSDGLSEGIPARAAELRRELAAARHELVVVHIGDDPEGRRFLAHFLAPGEAVLEAGDLSRLDELLRSAVHGERLARDSAIVRAPRAVGPAEPVWRAMGEESPPPPWAPLERAVRAELTSGAEAAWLTASGEPLLALKDCGGGLVATLATMPFAGGGEPWCSAIGRAPERLLPVLRALAERARDRVRPRLAWSSSAPGEVVLEHGGADWPLAVELVLRGPGAVDAVGRYVAGEVLERVALEPILGAASARSAGAAVVARIGRVRARRVLEAAAGSSFGGDVVAARGGRVLGRVALPAPGPAEATGRELGPLEVPEAGYAARPEDAPHPAAPWLVVLGALSILGAEVPRRALRLRRAG